MSQAVTIKQNRNATVVECPLCKGEIRLNHAKHFSSCNDNFGRMDIGEQNYTAVVCMNTTGGTCSFAGDYDANKKQWIKTR